MPATSFPSLKGRTYLITGGTSGIGQATAVALAEAGAHVVLTGRRETEGQAVAKEVSAKGVKGVFVKGDVTDEAHLKHAVNTALNLTGKLHGAFNNAGVELIGVNVADSTPEQYHKVFDINVLGVLLSMKHEIPALLQSGGGSIVNTASIAGSIGMAGGGIYIASKHAVLGFTKSAALEVAKQNIRINAVSPGAIETAMLDRFSGNRNADMIAYMTSLHPIGRLGRAPEIAHPVLFLLSDESSFITGADLKVDGGFTVP
jgi:NAD(P)-dependent dehydrogenase (short-subunit alcohol dehydrogenase family)